MTILKTDTTRAGFRIVGASLPIEIHNYLTLYTLSKGISKTKILKDLLEQWIDIQKRRDNEEDLLEKIVYRVNARWRVEKSRKRTGKPFDVFCLDLKDELLDKGLAEIYVENILIGIKK